jgi:modulator of FtsH protease HflK
MTSHVHRGINRWRAAWSRMFNLNDPRWGRGDQPSGTGSADSGAEPASGAQGQTSDHKPDVQRPVDPPRPQRPNVQAGPPDLDDLWRDFNQKLGGLFGGKGGGKSPANGGSSGGGFTPDPRSASIGLGLIGAVAVVFWASTGFFIVQEGQQAVITQFGRYHSTVGAGFNWRMPYPLQRHEMVYASQIRSVDVGRDAIVRATGLRESAMLTEDENIVEMKFAVQYRLNDTRAYLFESRDPDAAVIKAAETAVREVVGKMKMDMALSEERDQIAPRVRTLMQTILDRYKVGIEVVAVNMQQGGVRPPEQVQAAFDDVLKAGQERERLKNEAQAYANDVVPRAEGAASRLKEEAEGYRSRIVAQARGDSERFKSVYAEYQKAPQVTRERLHLEAMQHIYGNVTKVLVDGRSGGNLLYLPLEKIMKLTGSSDSGPVGSIVPEPSTGAPASTSTPVTPGARNRASDRSRSRDVR